MSEVRFNINENVRIKLTDIGRAHHRKWWERISLGRFPYTPPEEDADGWSRWQMWDLMHTFGEVIRLGGRTPFETEIIIEDAALSESTPSPDGK